MATKVSRASPSRLNVDSTLLADKVRNISDVDADFEKITFQCFERQSIVQSFTPGRINCECIWHVLTDLSFVVRDNRPISIATFNLFDNFLWKGLLQLIFSIKKFERVIKITASVNLLGNNAEWKREFASPLQILHNKKKPSVQGLS